MKDLRYKAIPEGEYSIDFDLRFTSGEKYYVRRAYKVIKEKHIYIQRPRIYIEHGRDKNRELVRIRDKHTCQDCGKRWKKGQKRFDVHHLNGLCGKKSRGYDRVNELDGLVTLCHRCHFNRPEHKSNNKVLTVV